MSRARLVWLVLLPVALLLFQAALASSDFPLGARSTVPLPVGYEPGLARRTTVLDEPRRARQPGFAAAVSVEAGLGGYLCSLVVLHGGVKVWASDHRRSVGWFAVQGRCQLELTTDGRLLLTDGAGAVGWSAAARRGAKALHLDPRTGNLVLLDAKNHTVWESFDKPMDKLLPGQWLRLPAYLTSSLPRISSAFYCLVLDGDKITAYIYFRETRYSYWELSPGYNRSMAFARMGQSGMRMFDRRGRQVARISPATVTTAPVSFLALGNDGNLGLYYFDGRHKKFRASYRALGFCELPLACGAGAVCSAAGRCKDFSAYGVWPAPAGGRTTCDAAGEEHRMAEMKGVTTVLSAAAPLTNVTAQRCLDLCLRDCSCAAALYVRGGGAGAARDATADVDGGGVCSHYEVTAGAREVIDGSHRYSYWVKVQKGRDDEQAVELENDDGGEADALINKVMIIFGVIDVTCLLVFAGICVHYCFCVHRHIDNHAIEEEEEENADPLNGDTDHSGPVHS